MAEFAIALSSLGALDGGLRALAQTAVWARFCTLSLRTMEQSEWNAEWHRNRSKMFPKLRSWWPCGARRKTLIQIRFIVIH